MSVVRQGGPGGGVEVCTVRGGAMDELLARASLARLAAARVLRVLDGLGARPESRRAMRAARSLRAAAEALHDAADALEEYAYARFRESRFGRA